MVCMLGYYLFEITDVESVKKHITYGYARHNRLQNHPHTQSVGRYEERFSFTATLYHKHGVSARIFEAMARLKTPVWFVMPSGEACEVVIKEITIDRSFFDGSGQPLRQEVTFELEVYYGDDFISLLRW